MKNTFKAFLVIGALSILNITAQDLEEVIVTEPINSVKRRINFKREVKNSSGDDILWDILTVDECI